MIDGGIEAETTHIFSGVEVLSRSSAQVSPTWSKTNAVLASPEDFVAFNTAYRRHFRSEPPARITTCAQLLLDARVELDLIAYIGRT